MGFLQYQLSERKVRGPCSTPSNEWQLGARADEEPDRLRAGRFEVMRGKGHVVDPENIRPSQYSQHRPHRRLRLRLDHGDRKRRTLRARLRVGKKWGGR